MGLGLPLKANHLGSICLQPIPSTSAPLLVSSAISSLSSCSSSCRGSREVTVSKAAIFCCRVATSLNQKNPREIFEYIVDKNRPRWAIKLIRLVKLCKLVKALDLCCGYPQHPLLPCVVAIFVVAIHLLFFQDGKIRGPSCKGSSLGQPLVWKLPFTNVEQHHHQIMKSSSHQV